jgi:hypothetical protein
VDESGNQIAVFGRRGARPFTLEEMQRMYLTKDGHVFTVEGISHLDDKSPLPRVQQSLVPDEPSPTTAKPRLDGTIEASKPVSLVTKASVFVGSLGLFFALVGWRKLRGPRRQNRKHVE